MTRRRVAVAAMAGVAAILGAASLAWACTAFSTLNLSASSGAPQAEVLVKGAGAAAGQPVVVRWDSRNGVKLAETMVDANGNFSVPVKIPEARPGVHVLLATDGKGDIARQAFEVAGPGGQLSGATPGYRTDRAPAGGTDPLRLGVNLLALGLLAAVPVMGAVVLARRPAAVLAAQARSKS